MEQKIKIPVRKATQAIYNALATKNAGIIYILTDVAERNNIFLGDIPLGKVCRQPSDMGVYTGRKRMDLVQMNRIHLIHSYRCKPY